MAGGNHHFLLTNRITDAKVRIQIMTARARPIGCLLKVHRSDRSYRSYETIIDSKPSAQTRAADKAPKPAVVAEPAAAIWKVPRERRCRETTTRSRSHRRNRSSLKHRAASATDSPAAA